MVSFRKLQPKKYEYINKAEKGFSTVYGFIAQEVKEVLPDAVEIMENEMIPNIMSTSILNDDNILTLDSASTSDISFNYTDSSNNKYAILCFTDHTFNAGNDEVLDIMVYEDCVVDSSNIKIDISLNENHKIKDYMFSYDVSFSYTVDGSENIVTIPSNGIMLTGQKVNDFHSLNKSSIWTITTAALQEIDRQQLADKERIATLETKVETLESQLTSVLARLDALENNSSSA